MIRTLIFMVFVATVTPIYGDRKLWIEDLKGNFDVFSGLAQRSLTIKAFKRDDYIQVENPDKTSGFAVKFDIIKGFGKRPLTIKEAEKDDYIQVENPDKTSGFAGLSHWIKRGEWCYLVSLLFDENGQLAGMQFNQPEQYVNSYFGLEEQGFRIWNHLDVNYAYLAVYWVSEDKQTRINSYNASKVIRSDQLTVTGLNGAMDKVAADPRKLDSIWKRQACIPMMGTHYYYNMTQSLPCDKPMYPWFLLSDEKTNQLIGIAIMIFGQSDCKMEAPSTAAVKAIVPTGPQCLYDMVDEHHVSTLHVYFVDAPRLITC